MESSRERAIATRGRPTFRLLVGLTAVVAALALAALPASAQAQVDPGLDATLALSPAGFKRAGNDRLPTGPMSTTTFNSIGLATVPASGTNAVFYGASYERPDGALIVLLAMSSSAPADATMFIDRVIHQTLPAGNVVATDIAKAVRVEGESNGVDVSVIAFTRNGRGYAVLSFGQNVKDDGAAFARLVVTLAESTPRRADAKPVSHLGTGAVVIAATIALALAALPAMWRFVRRPRRRRHRADRFRAHDHKTEELPVEPTRRPSPRPTPR